MYFTFLVIPKLYGWGMSYRNVNFPYPTIWKPIKLKDKKNLNNEYFDPLHETLLKPLFQNIWVSVTISHKCETLEGFLYWVLLFIFFFQLW